MSDQNLKLALATEPQTEHRSTPAQPVEAGDPVGDVDRVVDRQDEHADPEADSFGLCGDEVPQLRAGVYLADAILRA